MSDAFATAWGKTGNVEGGYTNDPNDAGGPTNHGITEAVARAHGYAGDMKDLPLDAAIAIAKEAYWDPLAGDAVAALSGPVASELFDTGYLSGIATAGKMLQCALNLFRRADLPAPLFPALAEDGTVGKMTVYALGKYFAARPKPDGETVLLRCLNAQQGVLFMDLCRAKIQDEKFAFGWYLNRVVI